jgi:hypothetical protein
VTLHPDIVCFFLFVLCAGITEAKYVSSRRNWDTQGDAVL